MAVAFDRGWKPGRLRFREPFVRYGTEWNKSRQKGGPRLILSGQTTVGKTVDGYGTEWNSCFAFVYAFLRWRCVIEKCIKTNKDGPKTAL